MRILEGHWLVEHGCGQVRPSQSHRPEAPYHAAWVRL